MFKGMRYEGLYTAPSTDVSLSFSGSLGGMNWGGLSIDPTAGALFVNRGDDVIAYTLPH